MSTPLIIAVVCAFVALAYGLVSIRWILAQPAGNPRMQEIAAAIQAGAKAYLNRQYTTICDRRRRVVRRARIRAQLVHRHRLPDRRGAVGSDRIHRHEHLRARQRAHSTSRP